MLEVTLSPPIIPQPDKPCRACRFAESHPLYGDLCEDCYVGGFYDWGRPPTRHERNDMRLYGSRAGKNSDRHWYGKEVHG